MSIAVGTAEFRANLAKYLKRAGEGHRVIVKDRGRRAFVLTRWIEGEPSHIVGCMRDRTEYAAGEVLDAREEWRTSRMP